MEIKDVKAKLNDTVYYNLDDNVIPFKLLVERENGQP